MLGKNPYPYICISACVKKEFGSDTPKWVFNRGHPEISDAGSNRVNIKMLTVK
jgi:hypothetical protein